MVHKGVKSGGNLWHPRNIHNIDGVIEAFEGLEGHVLAELVLMGMGGRTYMIMPRGEAQHRLDNDFRSQGNLKVVAIYELEEIRQKQQESLSKRAY